MYRLQRLYPRTKLLRRELAFELFDALFPDRGIAHINLLDKEKRGIESIHSGKTYPQPKEAKSRPLFHRIWLTKAPKNQYVAPPFRR